MDANDVRQAWADRSGEYSPEYYAYYGPDETSEVVRRSLDRFVERDASVLELGCGSGRHLSHLHEHGFEDLAGVEINDHALDVMADEYPALATAGSFYVDAIEDVVDQFRDGRFDAVYSVETLQHVHSDNEWVFEEVSRITDQVLVTAEIEKPTVDERPVDADVNLVNGEFPLYYRDWERVFTGLGFDQVASNETKRDVVRTFESLE